MFSLVAQMESLLKQGNRIKLSFEKTENLLPSGTLYFVAHVLLALEEHPSRLTCDYPKDDVVEQLFQHIGFLSHMGLTPRKKISADSVIHWHFVTGHDTDTSPFHELLTNLQQTFSAPIRMGLYDSMAEAVTNCIQHAYEAVARRATMRRWWMFAERRDNKLRVAICDFGIGIAQSLRQKPVWKDIIRRRAMGTRRHDRMLLAAAVGSRRSRTMLDHRGKGLPEMLEFVRSSNIGGFLVYSNHGAFSYSAHDGIERRVYCEQPFNGTLIQWELQIDDGN